MWQMDYKLLLRLNKKIKLLRAGIITCSFFFIYEKIKKDLWQKKGKRKNEKIKKNIISNYADFNVI